MNSGGNKANKILYRKHASRTTPGNKVSCDKDKQPSGPVEEAMASSYQQSLTWPKGMQTASLKHVRDECSHGKYAEDQGDNHL